MNICVLMASPRKNGNTAAILKPFLEELSLAGHSARVFSLYAMDLRPCVACRACQRDWTIFGCPQPDDAQTLFDAVLACDLLILATPIYSWYCTPPLKTVLDRFVYGMNKYYGEEKGPSLWAGKSVALLTTCGYPPEKGADLWEEGVRRYCRHSRLRYLSMLCEHDRGYKTDFMDADKEKRARAFARTLLASF